MDCPLAAVRETCRTQISAEGSGIARVTAGPIKVRRYASAARLRRDKNFSGDCTAVDRDRQLDLEPVMHPTSFVRKSLPAGAATTQLSKGLRLCINGTLPPITLGRVAVDGTIDCLSGRRRTPRRRGASPRSHRPSCAVLLGQPHTSRIPPLQVGLHDQRWKSAYACNGDL